MSVPGKLVRSAPALLVVALVLGGLAGGSIAGLAALTGQTAVLIVVAVLVGATLGSVGFFGYALHRRTARLPNAGKDRESFTRRMSQLATRDQVASLVQAAVLDARNRLHGDVSRLGIELAADVKQLEALLNLHAIIRIGAPLPASRGWAASPDLLLRYVGEILTRRPDLVVECGSGLSTLWAALALESVGGGGRVVALEHDEAYAEQTRATLATHGVAHRAEVRYAPIEQVKVGAQSAPWYRAEVHEDLKDVDVLFVDGPIGTLGPQARYPAVPLFRDRLTPGAVVILDDADRPEEQDVVRHWVTDWPQLRAETVKLEKGAVLMHVPERPGP
jgi:predicted O-methyltransferase YrrM